MSYHEHTMKILFIGHRDPLHSSAGGYDKIANFPESDVLWDKDAPFGFLPMHKSGKIINTIFLDLKARRKMKSYDVAHYFYGDGLQFPFSKRRHTKIVATIHMDIKKRTRRPKKFIQTLQSLDGVVSLSTSQQKELAALGIRSTFIPHGFDKPEYKYCDNSLDKSKINIVISGSNYRDIETMRSVIRFCLKERSDIVFHLLGQPANVKEDFKEYQNAKCYPRLSDNLYYSLISDCDYSFLPLTFATANNALLEAEFLGVRSILPDIDGISDYAAPSPMNIYYNNLEPAELIFKDILKSNKSEELVTYSEKFLWKNIYPQLMSFYKSL